MTSKSKALISDQENGKPQSDIFKTLDGGSTYVPVGNVHQMTENPRFTKKILMKLNQLSGFNQT